MLSQILKSSLKILKSSQNFFPLPWESVDFINNNDHTRPVQSLHSLFPSHSFEFQDLKTRPKFYTEDGEEGSWWWILKDGIPPKELLDDLCRYPC